MRRVEPLVAASALQLAAGLLGGITAARRGRTYDYLWFHGDPAHAGRQVLTVGTALSAPAPMLLAQVALTARLAATGPDLGPDARGQRDRAVAGLTALGAMMVVGYLWERPNQHRLTPGGWDALETPLVVAGAALAGAMAVLGLRERRRSADGG